MAPQLSCGETYEIWIWIKWLSRCICKIESCAYGKINELIFSNPHPWSLLCYCAGISIIWVMFARTIMHRYTSVLIWYRHHYHFVSRSIIYCGNLCVWVSFISSRSEILAREITIFQTTIFFSTIIKIQLAKVIKCIETSGTGYMVSTLPMFSILSTLSVWFLLDCSCFTAVQVILFSIGVFTRLQNF